MSSVSTHSPTSGHPGSSQGTLGQQISPAGLQESAESARFPFEHSATLVLADLQRALAELLAAVPDQVRKAADVKRVFGVDNSLGWQTYRVAHASSPLAAGKHVPASVSIRKLLAAVEDGTLTADSGLVARLEGALIALNALTAEDRS